MSQLRRVAVAIDLSFSARHHQDAFAGIHRYSQERSNWEYSIAPFLNETARQGRTLPYQGIIARATPQLVAAAQKAGIPIVNIWCGSPVESVPSVWPDFASVGRMAAEHLLLRGYRQFAFHGFLRHKGSQLVWENFQAAIREAQCQSTTLLISCKCDEDLPSWERYQARLDRWIGKWETPLGALAIQDGFCRYLLDACRRTGRRVPEEVAAIGIGNEPLICDQPEPSFSSFDLGYDRIGYEAAALLDRLIDGETPPTEPIILKPRQLVLRRSTDVWLVNDPMVADAMRFISEHSHEGIRVADVAKHASVAVRSLERHFHAKLGRTVKEEISRLRLERAKRLLVESNGSIKSMARDCGFTSAAYFHQVFLQAEGVTPLAYRRRHHGGSASGGE